MKESLAPEKRRKFEFWRANPVGSLVALKRYPGVFAFVGIMVLMRIAHDANPVIWSYYVYLKFHWNTAQLGYALAFLGIVMALVFGVLTRFAIPKLGEHRAAYLGLFAGAIGFAGYAFATQGWMMYPWMLVWSLIGLAMPAINAIISEHVPATEQGELQGALSSVGGVTSVVAPVALTSVFAFFTGAHTPIYFPGAAFLASGLLLALAAILLVRIDRVPLPQPAE
jgi:DHA1 family tetracycline resistance protein-like MFS transporter